MVCQGEMTAHNLYGELDIITENEYNKLMNVMQSFSGTFQVMPTIIIPAEKVVPNFNEKELIGQQAGKVNYLWVWKDPHGNIWAETAFQGINNSKPPSVN